jgi:uncharacterized sulfatase
MKRWLCRLSLGLLFATAATAAPPNFIFVLIDDMGYGDLSCYGNQQVRTENVDRLAREGIRFTQFYVAAPICSPSRTALMTGQFPARWRITSYLADRKANTERGLAQWLDPAAPTLARALRKAGYVTGHFGKWHMGGQRDVGDAPLISEYGFDETLTQFEGLGDRILPLLITPRGTNQYALGSDKLGRGQITWLDRSKVTGAFVERTMQFIRKRQGKPFYVNVWPDDVHSPFHPPPARRGDGSKKELYGAVVKAMDDQLGPLFEFVRNQPELRTNTIIIVASDNGPEPGAGSAGLFRGHKGNLYEGGVREPFIVWAPGLMTESARGTVDDQTVIGAVDLLPSLLKLAEAPAALDSRFDGEDMSAAFLGRKPARRTKPLFWVRPPDRPGENGARWPDLSLRDGDWKLLLMEDGSGAQLYDLARDPGETNNLAAQNPKIVEQLKRQLLDWRRGLPIQSNVISK